MRIAIKILSIIILGGIGGVLMVGLALPYVKDATLVRHVPFLQHLAEGTTVIERTQRLVVNENSALEASISNAQKSVVEIQIIEKNNATTTTGLVLTNDGVVLFPAEGTQAANARYFVRASGADWMPATFLSKNTGLGLYLVRVQNLNLSPVSFGDIKNLILGQRMFALGVSPDGRDFVADGIVTLEATQQQNGQTSLRLDPQQGNGAGLFGLKGEMFGIFSAQHKTISLVSSSDIQKFLQSALTP